LNTLGGAIAIQTKSGRNNQGAALEYEAGSWGRQRSLVEYGGVSKDGSVDYIIGYQNTTENGWRKHSPSHVNQLFAKTGWQSETTKLDLTYIGSDNNLIGNGFTPQHLLSGDRDQIHTRPDLTNNYSHFLALNGSHWFNNDTMFSGNVYYRKSNRHTKNGDLWEYEYDQAGGRYNDLVDVVGNGAEELTGSMMNRSKTTQDTYGATGQITFNQDWMGKKNQFVIGAGYDYTLLRYKQSERVNAAFAFQDNGTPVLSNTAGVTINDTNSPPVIAPQTFAVNENMPNGTLVGTVVATDPNTSQTKTFSIVSGNVNSTFSINATTGAIVVTNVAALNFEATPTYSIVIKVQDNGTPALSAQATMTINVNNVNEAPVIVVQ
jgi:hypothetical protein